VTLYLRDEEKKANEQAKNALESHVFETKDTMYSEVVIEVSTEEQREVVVTALNEVGDWLEDEGYIAETKVNMVGKDFVLLLAPLLLCKGVSLVLFAVAFQIMDWLYHCMIILSYYARDSLVLISCAFFSLC